MPEGPELPRSDVFTRLVVIVLGMAAAIQFGLLLLLPGPAPAPREPEPASAPAPTAPAVKTVHVRSILYVLDDPNSVQVVFDQPLASSQDLARPLDQAPGSFSPALPGGTWTWLAPNMLGFTADAPLSRFTRYRLTLHPAALLPPGYRLAQAEHEFVTGTFQINYTTIDTVPEPGRKGWLRVKATLQFNTEVTPQQLLAASRLEDPDGSKPQLELEATPAYPSRDFTLLSEPVQRTDVARAITYRLDNGLTPESGTTTLGPSVVVVRTARIVRLERLEVTGLRVISSGDLTEVALGFNTPVNPEAARRFITVSPQAEFTAVADGNRLRLSGKFLPGQKYALTVGAGLEGADEVALPKDWTRDFTVPDLPARVDFADEGMFLSRSGYKTLALESVNLRSARVAVDRVYPNNIYALYQYQGYYARSERTYGDYFPTSLGDRIAAFDLPLGGERNQEATTQLGLAQYIKDSSPGLYRVLVDHRNSREYTQRWVLITDLGIAARRAGNDWLVWVASFADVRPVPGVALTFLSNQNQVMATARTDASGLARVTVPDDPAKKRAPFLILAEKGQDFSFLLLPQAGMDLTGLDVGGADIAPEGFSAYLYGERDIYRPGEAVHGAALVRDAGLAAPKPMPFVLKVTDPKGSTLAARTLRTDGQGLAEFSLDLPGFARTGRYTAQLLAGEKAIGTYSFLVEEFVPDRIKAEISPREMRPGPGEDLGFAVDGAYLYGAPAAGLSVEAKVRLTPADFTPKGFEGYVFGDPERTFNDQEILAADGRLDDAGQANFNATVPSGLRPPAALNAVLTARVQESGGRGVTATRILPVHAYDGYPGLRRLRSSAQTPNQPVDFSYVYVTSDGKEAPAPRLVATLIRDVWRSVVRRTPAGSLYYEAEATPVTVLTQAIEPGQATGSFRITPPTYGSYRLLLENPATGATASLSFYAGGWGFSPWALKNPARLELVPDKDEHESGEVAEYQVRAPFPGTLLVTVEGSEVHDVQVLTLTGNTGRIRVPVKAAYSPNVYVTAMLVRAAGDLEPGGVARAFGAAPLSVNRFRNRLDVRIAAEPRVRPNRTLEVAVQATPGAVLTLAAVDEGILQLVDQKDPDPFGHFYAKRRLGVAPFDIFAMLLPELEPRQGASPTGGDADLQRLRQFVSTSGIRRVKPVAYWFGPVVADAAGKATFQVPLPEFQGALRLTAVASAGKRFGAARATTLVRSPLVLTPTLPRFLGTGDGLLAPVTLRNDTPVDGSFRLRMEVAGAASTNGTDQVLDIPKGREATTLFPVSAGMLEGAASFRFTAGGNGETAESAVELPVRSPLPPRAVVAQGAVNATDMALPSDGGAGMAPGSARRTLRIGLPLVRYGSGLSYLLHYPYGCVEQTTSSAFPLIYFKDLAKALNPKFFAWRDPALLVQAGVYRLRSMLTDSGGLAMWPGGGSPHPWGTVYAAHFLLEARQAGYDVDEIFLHEVLGYVAGLARNAPADQAWDRERTAYALYVLARAGKPDLAAMNLLRSRLPAGPPLHVALLLGGAYALTGDLDSQTKIVGSASGEDDATPAYPENFGSARRNLGMALQTALDTKALDLAEAGRLALRLADNLKPGRWWWYNTQETATGFMALGKYFAAVGGLEPYAGRVLAGDTEVGTFTGPDPVVFTDIPGDAPLRIVLDKGKPGSVFFSLETRGLPLPGTYESQSSGIEAESTLLDRAGDPVQGAVLRQGDLLVLRTNVRSTKMDIDNVVVMQLLPAGLEVENTRLASTEGLAWVEKAQVKPDYQDLRDDRILIFSRLPRREWVTNYSLVRVVHQGDFTLPPVQAEAMYDPTLLGSGREGRVQVEPKQ